MNENDARRILGEYVDHWNRTIETWKDPRRRESLKRSDPFLRKFGDRLSLKLMPEPFWGKTREASIVVANFNPGGYDEPNPRDPDDNGHYASWRWLVSERTGTYGDFAERLPVFGALPQEWRQFENYGGRTRFWGSRIRWADRIVSGLHINAGARRPVGMELCGWHSVHWDSGHDDTESLLAMEGVEELVLKPFEAALTLSSARLGLCVGAGYERVLERMQFERVEGWGKFPVYRDDGDLVSRSYALYRKGNIRVLVTKSAAGHQTCPGKHFASHEIGLLTGTEHLLVPAQRAANPSRRGSAAHQEERLVPVLKDLKSKAGAAFPACYRGAADNVLVLCEDAGAGWRLSVSVSPKDTLKIEVHPDGRTEIPSAIQAAVGSWGPPTGFRRTTFGPGKIVFAVPEEAKRNGFSLLTGAAVRLRDLLRGIEARPHVG